MRKFAPFAVSPDHEPLHSRSQGNRVTPRFHGLQLPGGPDSTFRNLGAVCQYVCFARRHLCCLSVAYTDLPRDDSNVSKGGDKGLGTPSRLPPEAVRKR